MSGAAQTSRQAVAEISGTVRKTLGDLIESVVASAMRSGARDLSMKEIQAELRRVHGRDVEVATISARVNELVTAKRLVRDAHGHRPCRITGKTVAPLTVPLVQERMFY
jgi:hypothetical protein